MDYYFEDDNDLNKFISQPRETFDIIRAMNSETSKSIADSLKHLLGQMERFYTIEKGVLALLDKQEKKMRFTHIIRGNIVHKGITLVIKNESSMMYQALNHGFPIAENYPDHISTNILEKKTIISDLTRAVLVIPLIHNSTKLGVVGVSSEKDNAFGIYLEDVGKSFIDDFSAELYGLLMPKSIKEEKQ